MSILKFWPAYPAPFFCQTNFLGLANHARESSAPAHRRSSKMLPIDFSSQKPEEPTFKSPFRFFHSSCVIKKKKLSPLQIKRYRDAFFRVLLKFKLPKNLWKRTFESLLQNFFSSANIKYFKPKNKS